MRGLACSLLTVKQEDVLEELLESDIGVIARLMTDARACSDAGTFQSALCVDQQQRMFGR